MARRVTSSISSSESAPAVKRSASGQSSTHHPSERAYEKQNKRHSARSGSHQQSYGRGRVMSGL